jgi:hypothetical protein
MKLYVVEPDNKYAMACLVNFERDKNYLAKHGWQYLKNDWHSLEYKFHFSEKDMKRGWNKIPDICFCSPGGMSIPINLIDSIFPNIPKEIELLPIVVEGQDWLLLNCLKTTKNYDEKKSQFFRRGEKNQIFMFNHVVVCDASVLNIGLFTLEDSNRAWIIATESFVDLIKNLALKGLGFREIGVLEQPI